LVIGGGETRVGLGGETKMKWGSRNMKDPKREWGKGIKTFVGEQRPGCLKKAKAAKEKLAKKAWRIT